MTDVDYAKLERDGWRPVQVNWFWRRNGGIEHGTVRGKIRFTLIHTTSGVVLLDGPERVGDFATRIGAKYVADQRAECVGVVHRCDFRAGR